jgi:uncharacterized protein YndB with AHSA1/START domain
VTDQLGGTTVVEFPNDLEILVSRDFDAPIGLVFDVLWNPLHLRETIAPFGETVTDCSVDLRPGGGYHFAFVPEGADECVFRGVFQEVEPPTRTLETWRFEGWPDVEAVESFELRETDGRTHVAWRLAFPDQAARDHMDKTDGIESNFEILDRYLTSLQRADGSRKEDSR